MAKNDLTIQAGVASGEGGAMAPGKPPDEEMEWTLPPSMTPESGYDPEAPKVHRSPTKEEIYPEGAAVHDCSEELA